MADWKAILGAVAPKLAGALGGPLAGSAVAMVSNVLLGNPQGSEAEIEAAIATATPAQLVLLKKADQEYEIAMAQIASDDRGDARALAKVKGMVPQIVLSVIYTVGYFAIFYFLMTSTIDLSGAKGDLIKVLMGGLTAAQIQIMNFWFGSSSGSKTKG